MAIKDGSRFMAALTLTLTLAGGTVAARAAGDAGRGAALYLQLPGLSTSCVGCHGPDPAANRNNLLRAADQPAALVKALNTVSAMGFLRDAFDEARIADLSAYLGTVLAVAAADAPVAVWPRTLEFGRLGLGEVSALHRLTLQNRGTSSIALAAPRVVGLAVDLGHDCPASLPPGATCGISLRASAASLGRAAGALVLGSDASSTAVLVPLSYEVTDGPTGRLSLSLPDGSDVAAIDFGSALAQTVTVREFALRSHGTSPVTLGVAAITGPGAAAWVLGGDCAAERVLEPGASCSARLTWTAGAPAPVVEAVVQWRSSGASPGTLKLQGSVSAVAVPAVPPPVAAPVAPGTPAGGAGGGAFGAAWLALLGVATLGLVMGRSRERHAMVTQGS